MTIAMRPGFHFAGTFDSSSFGVHEWGQLDLLAQGGNVGLAKQQLGRPLPLGALLSILCQRQHIGPGI
jgi:hypothetical protein